MPAPTLDTSRLLWRTRGRHWDYEFVCVPTTPTLPAWLHTLNEILGDADPSRGELVYGQLEVQGANPAASSLSPFCGIRFFDPERCDWTARPVQHFAIWFPEVDDVEEIPVQVPVTWYQDALDALGHTYGSSEAFGLPEAAVRGWARDHAESRAAYVLGVVQQTRPCAPKGEVDATRWAKIQTVTRTAARVPMALDPAVFAQVRQCLDNWSLEYAAGVRVRIRAHRARRLLLGGMVETFAECLAALFDGACGDHFVAGLAEASRRRDGSTRAFGKTAWAGLDGVPLNGARLQPIARDRFVRILRSFGYHRVVADFDDARARTMIAEAIGMSASPRDLTVRSLVDGLRR